MCADIMIVDDSATYVHSLDMIIKEENHHTYISYDGSDIFKILDQQNIDVILLDVIMPGIDGFELLKKLQNADISKEIPVIMITALTEAIHVKKALDMGAMDYIKKPPEPIEVMARIRSALRLKAKQDLLREFAIRDGLTQLFNRAYISVQLNVLFQNRQMFGKGVTFAMLDCDHFKRINDTYGHLCGDEVLCGIANVLTRSLKNTDIIGRYGGEEFCCILPNTTWEEGYMACERLRSNVQKMQVSYQEEDVSVTISIGFTHISTNEGTDHQELIHQADQALYMAKNNGRNRVESYKKIKQDV